MALGDDLPEQTLGTLITPAMYNELVQTVNFLLKGNTVGDIKHAMRTTDISTSGTYNWLICDGRTIGDASSGADIASATMQTLFTHLWDAGYLVMKNSSGGTVSRGVDAITDWNAHRRLHIPDTSGRVLMNLEHTTGFWLDPWSDNIGGTYGTADHTLVADEIPTVFYKSGSGALAVGAGSSALANSAGGDAHNNTQPTYTVVHLICTGA